jgi:excisionase family DNA binding protein
MESGRAPPQPLTGRTNSSFKDKRCRTDNHGKRADNSFSRAVEASMAENELLTPAEVAVMFRVNPKTVTRWARAGKISAVRTLGGHRRFRALEIRRFLEEVGDLQA